MASRSSAVKQLVLGHEVTPVHRGKDRDARPRAAAPAARSAAQRHRGAAARRARPRSHSGCRRSPGRCRRGPRACISWFISDTGSSGTWNDRCEMLEDGRAPRAPARRAMASRSASSASSRRPTLGGDVLPWPQSSPCSMRVMLPERDAHVVLRVEVRQRDRHQSVARHEAVAEERAGRRQRLGRPPVRHGRRSRLAAHRVDRDLRRAGARPVDHRGAPGDDRQPRCRAPRAAAPGRARRTRRGSEKITGWPWRMCGASASITALWP